MSATSTNVIMSVVIGMGVLNFALRYLPLLALSRFELPEPIMRWLSFIPIAVMGSLFASEVLLPSRDYSMPLYNPGIYGALISMLVYRFTKSFIGATMAGVISFVLIRAGLNMLGLV